MSAKTLEQYELVRKLALDLPGGRVEGDSQDEWPSDRVRQTFIDYFVDKQQHRFVPSSPCVPLNDPTLLFANAGMNQFKPLFLGTCDVKDPMYGMKSAANSQKCIRAGGKHNDLEDVGKDTYHHTFFEMLGNWSFADYFKEGAIAMAWELLVDVYGLDPNRIYATYFGGEPKQNLAPDLEAQEIWRKYLPDERILPFDMGDNFWEMGDTGPCGPCTEIHYDRIGGRDASSEVNMDSPDVIEIWNLVFMQFNREGPNKLKPLPECHVDTGMGFERITSILQNVKSNYDTDCFMPLFRAIQAETGFKQPYGGKLGKEDKGDIDMAYRVISDHIRTATFALVDGARPGNVGRDYVIKRVIRRACRYGTEKLGAKTGYFSRLVPYVVELLGDAFPGLKDEAKMREVQDLLREEEFAFARTLGRGTKKLRAIIKQHEADGREKTISGKDVFKLYDTYGFPADLTELMAEELGFKTDRAAFDEEMDAAAKKSRLGAKKAGEGGIELKVDALYALKNSMKCSATNDMPKYGGANVDGTVLAIWNGEEFVDAAEDGTVGVVLDTTSFYAESGGQVGDTGALEVSGNAMLDVQDTQTYGGYVLHTGRVVGSLVRGGKVTAAVDYDRRQQLAANHTMTHVLNLSLRSVLGPTDQKGSVVDERRLRFDFNANSPLTYEQLAAVEKHSQDAIGAKMPVYDKEIPYAETEKIASLRAMFGEKYPEVVRVVTIGESLDTVMADPANERFQGYSIELCGGTHLKNTGDAGDFLITGEEGVARGVRRLVCITGDEVDRLRQEGDRLASKVADVGKLKGKALTAGVAQLGPLIDTAQIGYVKKKELGMELKMLNNRDKKAKKGNKAANKKKAVADGTALANAASGPVLVGRVEVGLDSKALKEGVMAAQKLKPGLPIVFFSTDDTKGKVLVMASVPKSLMGKLKAGDWVKAVLAVVGGKGGGKPNFAQGQGKDLSKVDEAIATAATFATERL